MEAAKPLLAQDKDHFSMEISGKVYTERKEAGAAIIEACKALKAAGTEGRISSYGAFELHSRFDNFDKVFRLSIKGAWNYSMEVGKDPLGNILRVTNALAGIERALPQVERRLENLEQQLAQAKEEAKRPFAQEAELAEKSARLAELNSLLNMDEKGSEDALGVDEDVVNELDVPILCMGLKDVVVSASPEGILVSDKEQSSYIKPYVNTLDHRVMFAEKSWGSFKVIDIDKASMTIKVTLNAGHQMNYHSHQHRDEVWTVIAGKGKTIVDGMEQNVKAGDVITMSAGCRHTVIAETELKLIEVQLGEAIDVHDKQKFELEY